jgi:hypothetical protein
LVKERDAAVQARAAELEAKKTAEGETIQEKLVREKEERKKAALERSLQRQADKAYFEARKKANEEKKGTSIKSESNGGESEVDNGERVVYEGEEGQGLEEVVTSGVN